MKEITGKSILLVQCTLPRLLPIVSVIIPAFNEELTIRQTLESVLNQNYPRSNYEVLVVDNDSKDATREIASSFGGVKVLQCCKRGAASSRNYGAKRAKGDFIAFLDADVIVSREWLYYLILEFLLNNSLCCVSGSCEPIKDGSLYMDFATLGTKRWRFQGYNVAFKRSSFLEMGGYDVNLGWGEDHDLTWNLFARGYKLGYAEKARAYHLPYGLKHRLARHFHFSFWDSKAIIKNFTSYLKNSRQILNGSAPDSVRMILFSYILGMISWISILAGCVEHLLYSSSLWFLLWLTSILIPSIVYCTFILKSRKTIEFKNSVLRVIAYAFPVLALISFLKSTGFFIGTVISIGKLSLRKFHGNSRESLR